MTTTVFEQVGSPSYRLAPEAKKEERERCALICREYAREWAGFPAHEAAAEEIEKRIRSEE